jgi:hypothetical protein
MEEIREKKQELRSEMARKLSAIAQDQLAAKTKPAASSTLSRSDWDEPANPAHHHRDR